MSAKQRLLTLSILSVGFLSLKLSAHDTNVTHPVLSLQAVRLIESKDKDIGAFAELYRKTKTANVIDKQLYPLHWGVWNSKGWKAESKFRIFENMEAAIADDDTGVYPRIYQFNEVNVISGGVREDHPTSKVLNHFYHAYTAAPLIPLVSDNSKERAMQFLVRSINQYGYEVGHDFNQDDWYDVNDDLKNEINANNGEANKVYFAKQLAFQSFGEALHHVEDMSSIAHVQSDAHLLLPAWVDWFGIIDEEKEDYEGLYVPNKIFQFHNGLAGNWFLNNSNYAIVCNKVGHPYFVE